MSIRLNALVAVTVCGAASLAHAQVRRWSVVVTPLDDASSSLALATERSLNAKLAQDERFELVDLTSRFASEDASQAATQVSSAKAALDEVAALISKVEFESARTRAELALTALKTSDFRVTRDLSVQLLLQLARIKQALQVDDLGAVELSQALSLDPDASPLRGLNTSERKAFESARAALATAPRAVPVTVTTDGPRGWVWLDGRYRGVTPVVVDDVVPGRHFMTFVIPGARAVVQSELFGSIATLKLAATPTPDGRVYRSLLAGLDAAMRKNQALPAARDLLAWAKVDELIAVGVSQTGAATLVRVSATGQVMNTFHRPDLVAVIRELAVQPLQPFVAPSVAESPVNLVAVEQPAAHANRGAGVALLVVGALAAGAGVVMMVAGQGEYRAAEKTPQVQTENYTGAVARGNGLMYGGIATTAAGGIAAAVGLVLAF